MQPEEQPVCESNSESPRIDSTSRAAPVFYHPAPSGPLPGIHTLAQHPQLPQTQQTQQQTQQPLRGPSSSMGPQVAKSMSAGRRYQPYLSNINTDRGSWEAQTANSYALSQPPQFGDSPGDSASTGTILTSSSYGVGQQTYDSSSMQYPYYPSTTPASGYGQSVGMGGPSEYSSQPRSLSSGGYPAASLQYAPAIVSPTGGSPTVYGSAGGIGARRHTVSGFPTSASDAGSAEIGENGEVIVKEDKRRRNKESSQRFRDRTRERQREKQERLEYLERRVKDLDDQLRDARSGIAGPTTLPQQQADVQNLVGPKETTLTALQRLQRENDGLRAALKTAEQEIIRCRSFGASKTAFNTSQVYGSLPNPSRRDSARTASDSSSPTPDSSASYFPHSLSDPNSPHTSTRMQSGFSFSPQHQDVGGVPQHHHVSAPSSATRDTHEGVPWGDIQMHTTPVPMGQGGWQPASDAESSHSAQ